VAGYTKMVYPQTVTHPSINRTRRRVTPLIETNALPLSQATTVRWSTCVNTIQYIVTMGAVGNNLHKPKASYKNPASKELKSPATKTTVSASGSGKITSVDWMVKRHAIQYDMLL